ncbi:hypothetical protein PG988_016259 [Apiospora saccharicola]
MARSAWLAAAKFAWSASGSRPTIMKSTSGWVVVHELYDTPATDAVIRDNMVGSYLGIHQVVGSRMANTACIRSRSSGLVCPLLPSRIRLIVHEVGQVALDEVPGRSMDTVAFLLPWSLPAAGGYGSPEIRPPDAVVATVHRSSHKRCRATVGLVQHHGRDRSRFMMNCVQEHGASLILPRHCIVQLVGEGCVDVAGS